MDLTQRIERLERRRWQATAALIADLVIGVVSMGAARAQRAKPSEYLETKSLRLYDDQGNLRGFLASSPKGNVALSLFDQQGKLCAVLGVTKDANPSLELSHSDNTLRARLALAPDGHPAFEFYDAEGKVIRRETP